MTGTAIDTSGHPSLGFGTERVAASLTAGDFTVRLGWGPRGVEALVPTSDVVIVVDVITFSTAVSVVAERGCTAYPFRWDPVGAAELARSVGAELAVSRSEVGPAHPYSLSPVTLSRIPLRSSIVLPSPNGSALAAAASVGSALVLAGCLRNAAAVARFARSHGRTIAVIAAGERWPDQSLDPALEDLVGAGAIIDGLRRRRRSPEAAAAAAVYLSARRHGLLSTLRHSISGRELQMRGYGDEVEWAGRLNVSSAVPVLRDGAFIPQ